MSLDHAAIEHEIRAYWKKIDLLKLLQEKNAKGPPYFLLDGPPYANYVPHVGHIRNTVFKDLYIRLAFMKGHQVLFQPGFDTHGLPIENMIEKELELTSKKDIKKFGFSVFVKKARDSAMLNKDLWLSVYENLGSWYAWKKPYLTYDNDYLLSAWWCFRQMWDKGMVYEGKKPVHWCPHCQTSLAGYEVTDSYKDVSDPAVYVKFKIKDKDEYLLVFTTTPWTLPSNVAIFIHPEHIYAKVKTEKGILILAKERLNLLDRIKLSYEVIAEFPGKELGGISYEPLLDVPVQQVLLTHKHALRVYLSQPILKTRVASKVSAKKGLQTEDLFEDFVTITEGTGLVHCAPGHGKTDNEMGNKFEMPAPSPLTDDCTFTEDAGKYAGTFVKDADHAIMDDLDKAGKLLYFEKIVHSYPLCWRCKSPLIFRLNNQWFIDIEPIKALMLKENEKVSWQPDFAKERFQNWVAAAEDWNFSRQRYWGIPIPIWKSPSGKPYVLTTREEISAHAKKKIDDTLDLHTISDLELTNKEGERLERVHDIFDVWFDSGVAPFASLGYPSKNKELFDAHFPVSRINESQDQIRGWFYSLMFCSCAAFGKAPYQTVSMPGWVVDAKGEKMSKSLGNVVFAKDALEEFGADMVRFYYCWDIAPYTLQKFNVDTIKKDVHKFFTILWNLHTLVINDLEKAEDFTPVSPEDYWILSRLAGVIKATDEGIKSFEIHDAGRALYEFVVNDLSRSYVQMVRERMGQDTVPLLIIHKCILEVIKALASISPFMVEKIYQNFKKITPNLPQSVHLERFPEAGERQPDLEEQFAFAFDIIGAGLAARNKAGISNRWPVEEIVIDTTEKMAPRIIDELGDLIRAQVNAKHLLLGSLPVELSIKPDYKKIGETFGEKTADALTFIKEHPKQIIAQLKEKEEFTIEGYSYAKEHFVITESAEEGYLLAPLKSGKVFLRTILTEELEKEGYARELTRRLQDLRKKIGLEKKDKVNILIQLNEKDIGLFEDTWAAISEKVGAHGFILGAEEPLSPYPFTTKETIKEKSFTIWMERC